MPFLDNLIQNNKRINVLLITHIDADHIGGAIKVFQQQKYSDIVDEVWFNGLRQIVKVDDIETTDKDEEAFYKLQTSHWHDFQEPTEEISAKQALMFAGLLHKREKKLIHLLIVEFLNLLPSVLVEKILEDPRFIVYRQYCDNSIQDVPIFSEMEDYLREQAFFDKNGIINCNFEALDRAIMFVIADWQKNCNTVVNEVSINDMYEVKPEYNYVLSQYFAELAWYFPLCQSTHLYELKRTLSRLL